MEYSRIVYLFFTQTDKSQPVLFGATTTSNRMKKLVTKAIRNREVKYGPVGEYLPVHEQIRSFRYDWLNLTRPEVNKKLQGGVIDVTFSGEEYKRSLL